MTDIGRATTVLDVLAESRGPLTLSELAARTGLPRSTVHRLIQALEHELYVVGAAEGPGYVLGPGLLKFGMNAHLGLLAANRGRLASLAREVNENVELAVFSGREVVVADQIASAERLKGVTKVGRSFSLHASCIGWALLAQLPDDRVERLLPRRLERYTERTVTDRAAVLAGLDETRRSGIAIDIEEHDLGICAVATGMRGPTGALQAVAVVMPTCRFRGKAELAVRCLKRLNPVIDTEAALRQCRHRPTAGRAERPVPRS
ncbi:IclR family transcriptional regulator [Streptomyces sp. JW3]|uniref:IclR family transcriptional regulator n=1 Tax=Streptomyces sp. JW3 TaxID=3456955 RepID=UPI003FA47662